MIETRVHKISDQEEEGTEPTLTFIRSQEENIDVPRDILSLLNSEVIQTGTLRTRNPITTHGEWWIPIVALATAGKPYIEALASVVREWLKQGYGRQVTFEYRSLRISASKSADVERLVNTAVEYEKQLAALHVTRAEDTNIGTTQQ